MPVGTAAGKGRLAELLFYFLRLGLVGFGALGLRMLTTPDAAWDQVPEISPEPVRQPSAI